MPLLVLLVRHFVCPQAPVIFNSPLSANNKQHRENTAAAQKKKTRKKMHIVHGPCRYFYASGTAYSLPFVIITAFIS